MCVFIGVIDRISVPMEGGRGKGGGVLAINVIGAFAFPGSRLGLYGFT